MLRLILLLMLLLAAPAALTQPRVNFPDGDLEFAQTDVSVKVRGGHVVIQRTWANGRWYINPAWTDLKLTLDAVDGSVRSIQRGGTVFLRTGNGVFLADDRFFIRQTTEPTGFRWSDREGTTIDYDAAGRMTGYANRNGVRVSVDRDGQGRIVALRDHAGAVALTLAWSGGQVSSITDRAGRSVSYTWSGGNLTQARDLRGSTWRYGYDSNGQLTSITDPLDRAWTVVYHQSFRVGGAGAPSGVSTSGRPPRDFRVSSVRTLTDPVGSVWRYEYAYNRERRQWSAIERTPGGRVSERVYDLNGRLLRQTENERQSFRRTLDGNRVEILVDERGLTTRRELDAFRNPTRITHPDGTSETWAYHPQWSFPVSHVDPRGTRTTWQYDNRGNLVLKTEAADTPEARVTRYVYDSFGQLTEESLLGATPAENVTTRHAYDAHGNRRETTDAEGQVTAFTHDVMGNVLTVTDARGSVWTRTWSPAGDLLTEANPLGHTTTHVYDAVGNRTRTTDPAGHATQFGHDARNRLTTSTDPLGGVTTMVYDAEGRLSSQTDASGQTTTYAYDPRGRLISVTDGAGNVTRTEYGDAASGLDGLVTAMVYPTFREEYRYDPRNRRTQVIRVHPAADGGPERRETTTTAYDGVGNVIAEIDALGRTTQHTYDRLNRRIETTDPLGGKTVRAYDLRDNLTALTDAAGNTHRFTYDKVNRMRTEARPMGQTIRYAYDAAGNLTERADPLNQRQVHTYDAAGRRTKTEAFAAGAGTASRTITFNYDPRGLLTGYDDGTTSATYAYDANGQKLSETVDYGRFSLTQGYGYHPNGQKASWTAPDGTVIGFAYTGHGELREVSLPGQGAITMSDFRWTRPETVSYPGGAIRSERYDALQRTRQITLRAGAETRMDWRYTYDAVGNISRIDTEHGRYSFGYDALDRLIEADYPNGPQHDQINASFAPNTFPFADDRYSYDPIGNRLSSQSQPGPWAYNGNSELIQSPFGTTTFNLAGSTTEERTPTEQLIRRFAYDTEERPTEVTNAQGQRIARYYHDPFGRRLWKTLEPGAQGHSGAPGPETIYLAYNDEGYAAEFRLPGTPDTAPTQGPSSYSTLWVHEPDGLWSTGAIAIRIDGHWRYPQHDHLDTPRMLIDGQGAVTTTIRMNAFGETRHSGEAIANRFPGQVYDAETGLHYNYFRSYQPRTGRYTQADPIGVRGGINIFAYVASSPVLGLDVDGRVKWKGQSFTRAAAIYSVTDFTLHSECKCGVKWTVFVKARGVSLGRGYTWAGERNVELEDPFECPDPYALQGDYLDIGAGAAFAFGTEISFTWLGTAHSGGLGFSMLAGFATDAAITYGTSRVVGKIRQPCNKCE